MLYLLKIKHEDGSVEEQFYRSLAQIADDLGVTYCTVYKNFKDSVDPESAKPARKLSQKLFDMKYEICLLLKYSPRPVIRVSNGSE